MDLPLHSPLTALQSSLISGKFSDLKIAHGKRVWSAHKVVVCSQSPVLEGKIDALRDAEYLVLDDYNYNATCSMIEYLYTSSYIAESSPPDFELPLHVNVFFLSIQLSIPGLQQLAVARFRNALNTFVKDANVYLDAVRLIYASTKAKNRPDLRDVVIEAAAMEMRSLLEEPARTPFLKLTADFPEFQGDLYMFLLSSLSMPLGVVIPHLCEECGPRDEDDGYEVTTDCKGCGQEKTLSFT